eukprot:2448399-Rhodomonas_salina.1
MLEQRELNETREQSARTRSEREGFGGLGAERDGHGRAVAARLCHVRVTCAHKDSQLASSTDGPAHHNTLFIAASA